MKTLYEEISAVIDSNVLSSPNVIYLQVLQALSEDDLYRVEQLIKFDSNLTASVLHVANSSVYHRPVLASTVKDAICIIGSNMVRSVILSLCLKSYILEGNQRRKLYEIWQESIRLAVSSYIASKFFDIGDPNKCLTFGMLLNIGKLPILVASVQSDFDVNQVLEQHLKIGRMVASKWKFPDELCGIFETSGNETCSVVHTVNAYLSKSPLPEHSCFTFEELGVVLDEYQNEIQELHDILSLA